MSIPTVGPCIDDLAVTLAGDPDLEKMTLLGREPEDVAAERAVAVEEAATQAAAEQEWIADKLAEAAVIDAAVHQALTERKEAAAAVAEEAVAGAIASAAAAADALAALEELEELEVLGLRLPLKK